MIRNLLLLVIPLSAIVIGCNPIRSVLTEKSPYEKYVESLEKASLDTTPMVEEWISAGMRVMNDSILVTLPFSESGFFDAGEPEARSYSFDVKAGQILMVENVVKSNSDGMVFLDLFSRENDSWKPLAHSDSAGVFMYEFDHSRRCLLRIQPELLVDLYYAVTISLTPALVNPVSRATNRSIRSFYGDVRDGGRRSHEGVDIFAPKGTPVIAPADGQITRVGTGKLGGKVIWMATANAGIPITLLTSILKWYCLAFL